MGDRRLGMWMGTRAWVCGWGQEAGCVGLPEGPAGFTQFCQTPLRDPGVVVLGPCSEESLWEENLNFIAQLRSHLLKNVPDPKPRKSWGL